MVRKALDSCGQTIPRHIRNRNCIGEIRVQCQAQVCGGRIFRGELTPADWDSLNAAEMDCKALRLHIVGRAMGLAEIGNKARTLGLQWGKPVNVVVIDFLQIMRLGTGKDLREQVSAFTRGAKQLASDLGACVVLLSQLRRPEIHDARKPLPLPSKFALKESGAIEEASNEVLILYRDADHPMPYTHDGLAWEIAWAKIAKCRDGAETPWPGEDDGGRGIRLLWKPEWTLFRNWPELPSGALEGIRESA